MTNKQIKASSHMTHLIKSDGSNACGFKGFTTFQEPLIQFIAKYNNEETKAYCCLSCRNALKAAQVIYKAKNNDSLKGFKF